MKFLSNTLNNKIFIKISEIILILSIFLISRLLVFYSFELNINDPVYGYHLLDKKLLKDDLLKSILYLHHQPFLWNLFNGIILKIFNGNIIYISKFFLYYHYLLTLTVVFFSIKISKIFNLSKKKRLLVIFFIILNPGIIFYENIFSYSHTTFCIFTILIYLIFKIFISYEKKLEVLIYFCIFLLGNIWALFQPIILIPLFFFILRFYTKFNKISFIFSLIFFLISVAPILKNKLIFGSFINSSKTGQDFATVFSDWQDYCGHPIKDKEIFTEKYFKKYQKEFSHPSLVGDLSHFNNLGMIEFGKNCFQKTIDRIFFDPKLYLKGRFYSFLASHGKFSFDYIYPTPKGWSYFYKFFINLYKDDNYKLLRQVIIFTFMMSLYVYMFKYVFFSKYNLQLRKSIFLGGILYFYLLLVATFVSGTEQERSLYTGFAINIIFFILILKNFLQSKLIK